MFFRVVLQLLYTLAEIVSLNLHSHGTAFGLPPSDCQLKILQILPTKLFEKILEPYLVRWSLPLFRYCSLIFFELSIK